MLQKRLVVAVSACAIALLPAVSASSASLLPTDKKPSDWTQSDMEDYGQDIMIRTACFGLLLAGLYGLIECICCLYCCCAPSPSQIVNKKRPRYEQFAAMNERMSKKLPGTTVFYIGAVAFTVALSACVIGTWGYWNNYQVAMVDTYDGVYDLSTDFANFVCSDDYGTECSANTVGDFLENAKLEAGDTFDSASAYLATLEDLPQGLEDAIVEADNTIDYLNDMSYTLDRINANITAANNILNDIETNPQVPTDVKDNLPEEIDEVDDGGLISDAIVLVESSKTTANDIKIDLDDYYSDTIESLRDRIDGEEATGSSDDRLDLFETIDDILESIFDIRDEVLDISDKIDDARPIVVQIFEGITQIMSVVFAIPAIILLFTTSCTKCCKGVCPMYLNLSFTYFCQMYLCIAAGFTLFFGILWNDICVVHTDVIEVTLGNYTTKIRDSEIYLHDSVMDVLKCGHNRHSDVDQNLAAILGIENEFNVSEYVDPVIADMYEVRDYVLNQTEIVEDAIGDIDDMLTAFTDYNLNTASYLANVTAGIQDCDDLLNALPSEDMGNDRDDPNEQAKMEDFYSFNFAAYQTHLDTLNNELALMAFIPLPYTATLTFETVQGLNTALMLSADWYDSDTSGTCDTPSANCADYGTTTWTDVNVAVDAADDDELLLNQVITENNDLRAQIEALRQYLVNIEAGINKLNAEEQAMTNSAEAITDDLEAMLDDITAAVDGLDDQIDEVYDIIDFVATAPDYLGCKWIGDFYVDVIKGDFCTDSVDALFNVSAPMVAVPTLMMLFFCFAAIYIPVLKDARLAKHIKPRNDVENAFDLENNVDANAPPPPALVLLDAEPEYKTNEVEMAQIDGAGDASVKRKKMTF